VRPLSNRFPWLRRISVQRRSSSASSVAKNLDLLSASSVKKYLNLLPRVQRRRRFDRSAKLWKFSRSFSTRSSHQSEHCVVVQRRSSTASSVAKNLDLSSASSVEKYLDLSPHAKTATIRPVGQTLELFSLLFSKILPPVRALYVEFFNPCFVVMLCPTGLRKDAIHSLLPPALLTRRSSSHLVDVRR
jgi:hypothetical protein